MSKSFYLSAMLAVATLGLGIVGAPAPAAAGPCFDRCMTNCNLARGYSPCRIKCSNVCQNRFQGRRLRGG
jgi:hypothetical protein